MSLVVVYSVFSNMFYIAFGLPERIGVKIFNWIIEALFLIELIMNFLTEYVDPEKPEPVRVVRKIAKHYVFKSTFLLDILSLFPFVQVFSGTDSQSLLMFKLLRLYRLQVKFPEEEILNFCRVFYRKLSRDDIIFYDMIVKNLIKIFKLIVTTIIITFMIGCAWYRIADHYHDDDEPNFISSNDLL